MNNSRPIVNISLLLGTIIAVSAFFLVFNNIPVQALHKEQQLLESFDDLADFAKAVKSGDEELEEIPIQSMKAADIYDDADDNLKDCIDQAAEIGDSLTDREVVHCVDDVNYFNNKYSNGTVPTNATSTATIGLADTGTDTTSTSNAADTTSTSNAADTTSTSNAADTTSTSNAADTTSTSNAADTTSTSNAADTTSTSNAADTTSTSNAADTTSTSNAADTTSTSDDSNENNLVDELVKTGKFTEAEAREFVSNNMQSGTGTDTTSDINIELLMQIPTLLIPHQLPMQIPTLLIPHQLPMQIPTLLIPTSMQIPTLLIPRLLMQIPTLLIPRLLMQIPTLLIPRLLMQIPTLIVLRPMTLPHPTTKTTIINLQIITAIILKTMTTLTS